MRILSRQGLEQTNVLEVDGTVQAVTVRQICKEPPTLASQRAFMQSIRRAVAHDLQTGAYAQLIVEPSRDMRFTERDMAGLRKEEISAVAGTQKRKRAANVILLEDAHRKGLAGESSIVHTHALPPEEFDFSATVRLDAGVCPSVYYPRPSEVLQILRGHAHRTHRRIQALLEASSHPSFTSDEQRVASLGFVFFALIRELPELERRMDDLMLNVQRQCERLVYSSTKPGSITFFRGVHAASGLHREGKPGSLWTEHYDFA